MRERERNIVLAGFKATGKTAVGKRLAERLGYTFVDVDGLIEAEAGTSIPRLFTERGEVAFREVESRIVERVAQLTHCVIATGGGTVLSSANLQALKQSGVVVTLTADLETLLSRLGMAGDRPILRGDDLRARVEQLLAERREAYAQADVTVDETVDCVLHAVKAGPFRSAAPRKIS